MPISLHNNYCTIRLEDCETKEKATEFVDNNIFSDVIVPNKDSIKVLHIYATHDVKNSSITLVYLMNRLSELSSLRCLKKIHFRNYIKIDMLETQAVSNFIKQQQLAQQYELDEISFGGCLLSTAALECLSLVAEDQKREEKEHMEQSSSSYPIINLSNCRWADFPRSNLFANDFPNQINVVVKLCQIDMQEAQKVINMCRDKFKKVKTLGLKFREVPLAIEAWEYLLSVQNDIELKFENCRLYEFVSNESNVLDDDIDNDGDYSHSGGSDIDGDVLRELTGKMSIDAGHCTLRDFQIENSEDSMDDNQREALSMSRLISQTLNAVDIEQICFEGCKLDMGLLQELLAPIIAWGERHWGSEIRVGFECCELFQSSSDNDYHEIIDMIWEYSVSCGDCNNKTILHSSIKILEDSINDDDDNESFGTVMKLLSSYPPFSNVTQLHITDNYVSHAGFNHIANRLNETNLQELFFHKSDLCDINSEILADVLRLNVTLTKLDLSGSSVTRDTMKHILDCLKSANNITLRYINIKECPNLRDDAHLEEELEYLLGLNRLGHEYLSKIDSFESLLVPLVLKRAEMNSSVMYWTFQRLFPFVIQSLSFHRCGSQKRKADGLD